MSGGFQDLGLLPELLQAVDACGWSLPTDIQDEAIPLILGGGDVMGAAETGSGKTAAFALPVIQSVWEHRRLALDAHTAAGKRSKSESSSSSSSAQDNVNASKSARRPLALIVEPTRDLAEQVFVSIQELSRFLDAPPLRALLLIGDNNSNGNNNNNNNNNNKHSSKHALREGVDIVVGTIGKLIGAIESEQLDLSQTRCLVLDEADKLSSADNIADIKKIFGKCPVGETGIHRLQVCFFSATLHSPQIRELADLVCFNPTWIDLKGVETALPPTIHHVVLPVMPRDYHKTVYPRAGVVFDDVHTKDELSVEKNLSSQRIKEMKPHLAKQLIDQFNMSQVLIFCRTNLDCANLESFFNFQNALPENRQAGFEAKYSCRILGGKLRMEERRQNLEMFKQGEIRMLICTDVAARGLDITGLPYVLQMTLPDVIEDYVHRIGRVGRADRMGLCISLVAAEDAEKVWYHRCSSKGANCANRELLAQGGCTIWYDERKLLSQIEKKISSAVMRMTSSSPTNDATNNSSNKANNKSNRNDKNDRLCWSLPEELSTLNCVYGETSADALRPQNENARPFMTDHMVKEVRQLAQLETKAQNLFLRINELFANTRDE